MNNEQTVQPEEILCAGQTEEGEMSEQSGSRTAGDLPCDSEGENRESSSEGEGEALELREEAPRGDGGIRKQLRAAYGKRLYGRRSVDVDRRTVALEIRSERGR